MSDNERKKAAVNNLLNGLISSPEKSSSSVSEKSSAKSETKKGRRGRPPRGQEWGTFCHVVNMEQHEKIRAIAQMTGTSIKEVLYLALADYINKVERKVGVIRVRRKIDLASLDDNDK